MKNLLVALFLLTCFPLTAAAADLPPVPEDAFSIVVLPDTQAYSLSDPSTFHAETRWIVDNIDSQNIAFVSHVGDIVDGLQSSQFNNAVAAMDRLHGVVPYGIAPGNHDMTAAGDTSMFQSYFPASRFEEFDWYVDNYGNNTNSAQLFSAAGKDYVFLHIACNSPDGALEWANEVLDRYADRTAFITTHMYLGPLELPANDAGYYEDPRGRMQWKKTYGSAGNTPQDMWDECFSLHDNVLAVFSGDQSRPQAMHRTVEGVAGNTVHELMSDYRDGYLRICTFYPDGTLRTTTYSPTLDEVCAGTDRATHPGEHVFTLPRSPYDDAEAHWTFDADFTDAAGTRHGTAVGSPAITHDPDYCITGGGALELNGTNEAVFFGDIPLAGDFTVSAWVLPENIDVGTTSEAVIFGDGPGSDSNQDWVRIEGSTVKIKFDGESDVPDPRIDFENGEWQHFAMTRLDGELRVYRDGHEVLVISKEETFTPSCIGNKQTNWFEGWIDEAAVWTRALSPSEIAQLVLLAGAPLEGDLNADGFVGAGDLDIVRANWGQTVPVGSRAEGDASGDGSVSAADLDVVRANWGAGTPPSAVPEPGVWISATISGILIIGRWRRRTTKSLSADQFQEQAVNLP